MLPHPESAYFVIADISGYTSFLAGVELDHAQDIIADLMDTVVKGLRPPFRLAKFEGDAAFVYAATAKIDGSMLQDTIEQAYFAFRRRLRDIKQASICECKPALRWAISISSSSPTTARWSSKRWAGAKSLPGAT